MATKQQIPTHQSNGSAEIERMAALLSESQAECIRLRQALAQVEAERDRYRKAIFDYARESREFEDADIASLEAESAGPVEMIG